ncbi:spore coat protein [Metabacillus litoralis]|uniref:spore coat protein n=1 Tax=Metabacillus litoralis TaxID=152268 RepID=UPI001CFD9757|nr:spore coat protein [Metabacillus litoralis]
MNYNYYDNIYAFRSNERIRPGFGFGRPGFGFGRPGFGFFPGIGFGRPGFGLGGFGFGFPFLTGLAAGALLTPRPLYPYPYYPPYPYPYY